MLTVSGPISSSTYITSRYAGFFVEVDAQRQRCLCAPLPSRYSQRAPGTPRGSAGRRASRSRSRACPASSGCRRLEPLVGLGVDTRDEERRDRRDLRRVAAARRSSRSSPRRYASTTALYRVEREDERDVDRGAVRDRVLDRGQARRRRRDLHVEVRPVDLLRDPLHLLERLLRVVRDARARPPSRRSRRRRPTRRTPASARRTRRGCPAARARRRSPSGRPSCRGAASGRRRRRRPSESAFWKIVGFDVTPTTASSSIIRFSSPVWTRSRESVSNQTDWPARGELVQP